MDKQKKEYEGEYKLVHVAFYIVPVQGMVRILLTKPMGK
jgi:hypothetical protein